MASSEAELIARVVALDDRHAFAQLVRGNQSQVRALLRRLTGGDEALADDLAQETFIRAYRGLPRFRGGARFSSWLYRIATNIFLSHRRKRVPEIADSSDVEASDRGGSAQVEARHDLEAAMLILNERERLALALSTAVEATHEEIADMMGCPLGTVKSLIMRAKDKLRRRLAPREETA